MKTKTRVLIGLILGTSASFALSVYFADKANLNTYGLPYPANVGNQYLTKRPKVQMIETHQVIHLSPTMHSLQIGGIQADVLLIPSQGADIEVSLKAGSDRPLKMSEDSSGVKVTLEGKKEEHSLSWFSESSPHASMEVKVPRAIQNLSIEFISANVKGEGFTFKNLKVENTSGDIKFTKTRAQEAKFNSVSGWIGLDGSFEHLQGDVISGDIKAYLSDKAPQVKLSTISGGIVVQIPPKADASIHATFLSGKFTIRNQGQKKLEGRGSIVFGKGTGQIELSTTSGDISID
jgi:DUF4097 and DUF4098 domain-containing protein YvlB